MDTTTAEFETFLKTAHYEATDQELRAAITDVNKRLIRCAAQYHRDGFVGDFEIWEPLATSLSAIESPEDRFDEAMGYEEDYVGALPDGALVIWGEIGHGALLGFCIKEREDNQ